MGQQEPLQVTDPAGWVQSVQGEYAGALLVFAYRAIGNLQDAEDVVQEVLVRVWRSAERFDPDRAAVSTWLFTIARNVVIDHRRRQQARPRVVGEAPRDRGEPPDDATAFDRAVEAWEMAEALRRLTADHREVIIEVYYRDRSVAQAAARLGIPAGTVKSRLYHGLRNLRVALQDRGIVG